MKNSSSKSIASALIAGFAITLSTAPACAPKVPSSEKRDATVERIRNGELIREIEKGNPQTLPSPEPAATQAHQSSVEQPMAAAVALSESDPCFFLQRVQLGPDAAIEAKALQEFGACLRSQLKSAELAGAAREYFIQFVVSEGERPLSSMTDTELEQFLTQHPVEVNDWFEHLSSQPAKLRARFSDSELDEYLALIVRKKAALLAAEGRILAAVQARLAWIDQLAEKSNRYEMLKALLDTAGDGTGQSAAAELARICARSGIFVPKDPSGLLASRLHPYAIGAVLPSEGKELEPIDPDSENPFKAAQAAIGELDASPEMISEIRQVYGYVRDMDNPPIPEHVAPAADAVRVAFLDSGIDFVSLPDLGEFLGRGGHGVNDEISSWDFSDGDPNPWIPKAGVFGHGSGTTATLLTIISHFAPEVLKERKLDLAMWKVYSIRQILSSAGTASANFENRLGTQEAVLTQAERAVKRADGTRVLPRILSVSMGFPSQMFMKSLKSPEAVRQTPWLWVMAAGNSGLDVSEEKMSTCFDDVPVENRPDARILCVGALKQGVLADQIANYSNFGPRVDVYAQESYTGLCPNGTSCSTPAVSAAAAIIAAKYPRLTPEQIKEVIVETAELRTLEVQPNPNGVSSERVGAFEVRVFDPPAMIGKALENARKKAGL